MSHVVIGGSEQQAADLRFLLGKWGMTVGRWLRQDGRPTVLDCDAVVLVGDCEGETETGLGVLPGGAGGAAGPAAPLVFLNCLGLPLERLPVDWLVLDRLDDDRGNLRQALQRAVARARALRGEQSLPQADGSASPADSYLHFLGHELRSPLTAIKTALEVLEGEMGGLDPGGDGTQSDLRMLAIALRNVRRLHRTVEWSQDLLAANEQPGEPHPSDLTAGDLACRLRRFGPVHVPVEEISLHVDTERLDTVVTQMVRTLEMAAPSVPVRLSLVSDPRGPHRLRLLVAAGDGEHEPANLGSHTRALAGTPVTGEADTLRRLASFMISSRLVAALGAELGVGTLGDESSRPVLSLSLACDQALAFSC